MKWLMEFSENARRTDQFAEQAEHTALLAAGLMGEAGSLVTELKKEHREHGAYPAYRQRMQEEIGDFLWYFVRLTSLVDTTLLSEFDTRPLSAVKPNDGRPLRLFLELGAAVGEVLHFLSKGNGKQNPHDVRVLLRRVWNILVSVACTTNVPLEIAAMSNMHKTQGRWPRERVHVQLFDHSFPRDEQLPRHMDIAFHERRQGNQRIVVLTCNGIHFGDRLTDNIKDPDGYRYHDIFHFSYVAHLGWSPVVRALLRCKRKSSSRIDESEDGARAIVLEEAISAVVHSRAKQLNFFDGLDHLDYDLLKSVEEFVHGYEVDRVPLWQWETAILEGYKVFRNLRRNRGGRVLLDIDRHQLTYLKPPRLDAITNLADRSADFSALGGVALCNRHPQQVVEGTISVGTTAVPDLDSA